jgi:hypothetical protein
LTFRQKDEPKALVFKKEAKGKDKGIVEIFWRNLA